MIRDGRFREDLYYRLNVIELNLPPLSSRPDDIVPLADHFLGENVSFGADAREALQSYSWPGNVRELHNVLERAAIVAEGEAIGPEHLSLDLPIVTVDPGADLDAAARRTIERVLLETDWNKAKAARRLGITRTQLYGRLRKYGLEGPPLAPLMS